MENCLKISAVTEGTVLAFFLLILIVLFSGRALARRAALRGRRFVTGRYRKDRLSIPPLSPEGRPRRPVPAGVGTFYFTRSSSIYRSVTATVHEYLAGAGKYPVSPWEQLVFNPVYLQHLPVDEDRLPGSGVIIGPNSRRPLSLKIPVLLGGMAYKILNAPAKQALALGATLAGTAANTGGGPFLPAERAAAEKLIVQYVRGGGGKDLEALLRADAIEIQLGRGLGGAASRATMGNQRTAGLELREILALRDEDGIPPRAAGLRTPAELAELIESLRRKTGGVPIGVKIGGTGFLEKELDLILQAGPDFLAVSGLEGGFWDGSGGTMEFRTSLGLPTLYLLVRARRFLEERKLRGKVTLLVGGGLVTPMDFLKAMALGADAVFIGSAALVALVCPQVSLFSRRLPVEKLFYGKGEGIHVTKAAHGLAAFLMAAVAEMQTAAWRMGKNHLREVGLRDLSALDRELAAYLGIDWCGGWKEGRGTVKPEVLA